jgi:voltage-gated potassium channel
MGYYQTNKFQAVSHRALQLGILLLLLQIVVGTLGYLFIEGYQFIDAFFMTVITISTVGFAEVRPLSPVGKIFTTGLIIFSLGSLAYIGSTFARFILDGELFNYLKTYRVDKKIIKLKNHCIIVGYGRIGEQIALELSKHGENFVVIDKREDSVSKARDNSNTLYIKGDATHEEILTQARIGYAKSLIAATPIDADNVFVVITAKSMNPSLTIISRASDVQSVSKLRRAGASKVIMPEMIGGQRMAKLVTQPDVVEFLEYILLQSENDIKLEGISCRNMAACFVDKTVKELQESITNSPSIIGIKKLGARYLFNPSPDTILTKEDQLFILGSQNQIQNFCKSMEVE